MGVETEWRAKNGGEVWSGWLPHLDLTAARAVTRGSHDHEGAFTAMAQEGTLTLRTVLDLTDLLRPAVQPGSDLDQALPDEVATLATRHGGIARCEISLPTHRDPPQLDIAFWTAEDPRPSALELRRFLTPWATGLRATASPPAVAAHPEFAGAKLRDGTASPALARIGPDLSRTWQRDFASVKRDVLDPNAALNPDHLADALTLGTAKADAIVAREPMSISIMPAGVPNVLTAQQVNDLLLDLLTPPLAPAPIQIDGAPPPRTRAERAGLKLADIAAVAKFGAPRTDAPSAPPLRLILVSGPKDHGAGEHDYPDWRERWSTLLALADGVEVGTADGWPSAEQLASADVLVGYSANAAWSAGRAAELDAFLARGGGLVLLHWAVNGRDAVPELAQRIGLASRSSTTRYRHGAVELDLAPAARDHPITGDLPAALLRFPQLLHFVDETYWALATIGARVAAE
ncbi:MAG: hypothetical protein EXS13_09830 [Planctomycetes bacterium]|nr:hypothetical protein [Planctomycetota bacterium]